MTPTDPIPHIETATDPVQSPADLAQRWRALMGPLGFGQRLIWSGFLGPDRRLIKMLDQMAVGPVPHPDVVDPLLAGLGDVLSELGSGFSVALLLSRPGRGPVSEADRRWAEALTRSARRFGVPLEPIFRANDTAVLEVTPTAAAQVR